MVERKRTAVDALVDLRTQSVAFCFSDMDVHFVKLSSIFAPHGGCARQEKAKINVLDKRKDDWK